MTADEGIVLSLPREGRGTAFAGGGGGAFDGLFIDLDGLGGGAFDVLFIDDFDGLGGGAFEGGRFAGFGVSFLAGPFVVPLAGERRRISGIVFLESGGAESRSSSSSQDASTSNRVVPDGAGVCHARLRCGWVALLNARTRRLTLLRHALPSLGVPIRPSLA